jgi:hypothetical protein
MYLQNGASIDGWSLGQSKPGDGPIWRHKSLSDVLNNDGVSQMHDMELCAHINLINRSNGFMCVCDWFRNCCTSLGRWMAFPANSFPSTFPYPTYYIYLLFFLFRFFSLYIKKFKMSSCLPFHFYIYKNPWCIMMRTY